MKRRLFVIVIGGTGARVLRSLVMLMAAGEFADREIVPIVVDYDGNNGDVRRALEALECYNRIHSAYREVPDNVREDMFASPSRAICGEHDNDWRFELELPNFSHTLAHLIDSSSLYGENRSIKYLIDSLYGINLNPADGLFMDICMGFKGMPNVSHLCYEYADRNADFHRLFNIINPALDEVAIVGSTFGGTGTSGICKFLTKIKGFCSVRTAVILIEPYYSLHYFYSSSEQVGKQTVSEELIDYDTFCEKSGAFEEFYHESGLVSAADVTYIIKTDRPSCKEFTAEGGQEQYNKAHIVELLSALTIQHFIGYKEEKGELYISLPECNNGCYTINDLLSTKEPRTIRDSFNRPHFELNINWHHTIQSLCSFAVASYWVKNNMEEMTKRTPLRMLFQSGDRDLDMLMKYLDDFIQMFIDWCNEMREDNNNPVNLFNFDCQSLSELITNYTYPVSHGVFANLFHPELRCAKHFHDIMVRTSHEQRYLLQEPSLYAVLHLLSIAGREIADEILNQRN